MSYSELVNLVERIGARTRFEVVSVLIGRNGLVTEDDWENINKLYCDCIVEV